MTSYVRPILLSKLHMGDREQEFVKDAFDTNSIAPVSSYVEVFEHEFYQKLYL